MAREAAEGGAVNPRSEAEPKGAEASTARFWGTRRAELHKRDLQEEPIGAEEFGLNECKKKDEPKAVPLNLRIGRSEALGTRYSAFGG